MEHELPMQSRRNRINIGVDLGGTKIEFIALDSDGSERLRFRKHTPVDNYPETIELIARNVSTIESRFSVECTVGIGIPGSISPSTGLVQNANSTWLNGQALGQDLSYVLSRKIKIENDANCFALSEAKDGSAFGAQSMFGVIFGTGVGGGLIANNKLIGGSNAIGGEWGHNPMPGEARGLLQERDCWCGQKDCIETYLSGPSLEKEFLEETGKRSSCAEIFSPEKILDPAAAKIIARFEKRAAIALSSVINIFDPQIIVLGGGLSNIKRIYNQIPFHLEKYIFSNGYSINLRPPKHGDSSGVRGAARLWDDRICS